VLCGDVINRGPRIEAAMELAWDLVQSGRAVWLMGNHEQRLVQDLRCRDQRSQVSLAGCDTYRQLVENNGPGGYYTELARFIVLGKASQEQKDAVALSVEAQLEARMLMMAPLNVFSPSSGKPIMTPTQDITLGCYYLTAEPRASKTKKAPMLFGSKDEVIFAYTEGDVKTHDRIIIANPDLGKKTEYGSMDKKTIMWRVILHMAFVASGLLFAIMDSIADRHKVHVSETD